MRRNYSILVISDLHAPYYCQQTVDYLSAIKTHYSPDRVILIGDEIDWHSIGFHDDKDPDLYSPNTELEAAIESLKPIYQLFPTADVIESNHGSLVLRKGRHAGLPQSVFKSYREILQAPKYWKWHFDLTVRMNNDKHVYFHHGQTGSPGALSRKMSMCAVQGHYHNKYHITYWANPSGLYWDVHTGCMADFVHYGRSAFAYSKNHYIIGINGCTMIQNGQPHLIPYIRDKKGDWIGRLT